MNANIDFHIVQNEKELKSYYNIRKEVFIEEQKCPEEIEIDEFEESGIHFIGLINGNPACTARLRFINTTAKFERLAVLKEYRRFGLGKGMLQYVLNDIDQKGYKTTIMHAQSYLLEFYKSFGFVKEGDEFLEAGIKHYTMQREKNKDLR